MRAYPDMADADARGIRRRLEFVSGGERLRLLGLSVDVVMHWAKAKSSGGAGDVEEGRVLAVLDGTPRGLAVLRDVLLVLAPGPADEGEALAYEMMGAVDEVLARLVPHSVTVTARLEGWCDVAMECRGDVEDASRLAAAMREVAHG